MIRIPNYGQTILNNNICLIHSDDLLTQSKPCVLMIGGVHGDEPQGVEIANRLVKNIQDMSDQSLLPRWLLIPCLNKDGLAANQRTNARGIDINRNYPALNWSKQYNDIKYNPGTHPASEPETQIVVNLVQTYQPSLIIHFHAYTPSVICTGSEAWEFAAFIAEHASYPLQNDIGYPTPGSLSAWAYHTLGIPVICIEENDQSNPQDINGLFEVSLVQALQKIEALLKMQS